MQPIATYEYMYVAGTKPNRRIEFMRSTDDPTKIYATVSPMVQGKWQLPISILKGSDIAVELLSSAEKIQRLMMQRKGQEVLPLPEDKKLSDLSQEDQDKILNHFEPEGDWRIEITNGIGRDPRFETVTHLSLFH